MGANTFPPIDDEIKTQHIELITSVFQYYMNKMTINSFLFLNNFI